MKSIGIFVLVVAICVGMVVGDCPVHCTLDYTPVCGEDADGNQQTYGNMCGYESEACKDPSLRLVKHGEC